ncbi:ATP-binding protein [Streptomyces sp. NBC_00727]|uniref:ATP-binding protein n=1 Tax=Streptomyces sp. NBC_00727 TaxID=2903675 RepID=UPI00386C586A
MMYESATALPAHTRNTAEPSVDGLMRPERNGVRMAIAEGAADGGRPAYSMSLPRIAESARDARLLTSSALGLWGLGDLEDTARLVVTELLSNAVAHARRSRVRVTVTRTDLLAVCLAVSDFSRDLPQLRQAGGDEEGGRGLAIIDAVTEGCWGAEPRQWGKTVWAVLAVPGVLGE